MAQKDRLYVLLGCIIFIILVFWFESVKKDVEAGKATERMMICEGFGFLGEEIFILPTEIVTGPAQIRGFHPNPERVCLYLEDGVKFASGEVLKIRYFYGHDDWIFRYMQTLPCASFYLLRLGEDGMLVYYKGIEYRVKDFEMEGKRFYLKENAVWELIEGGIPKSKAKVYPSH